MLEHLGKNNNTNNDNQMVWKLEITYNSSDAQLWPLQEIELFNFLFVMRVTSDTTVIGSPSPCYAVAARRLSWIKCPKCRVCISIGVFAGLCDSSAAFKRC